MKLTLVVNPISGGKNKEVFIKAAETMFEKYGLSWNYFNTTGENDSEKLRDFVTAQSPDKVVSIGGDGTTLMTALGLKDTAIPFGIIPMGSANGMAKELAVPEDTVAALLDIIMSDLIVPLDIIEVNGKYHTMHLGDVGINATMVERFSKEKGRGMMAYAKHFFDAVHEAKLFEIEVEVDGQVHQHQAYSFLIANTRMYGTGAIVNPIGNPHDGKCEIVIVTKNDWTGILNLGLTAFDPSSVKALEDYAEYYQCTSASIRLKEPKLLQLDGEVIETTDQFNVEILPKCVNYISTMDNQFIKEMKDQ